ncbi:hypothetical protein [Pseudomonas viridiflava]|uniref:hypothetical protein n=1 Tax=Pseudomonas viridiflava TaxID=33069 RepID=UPI0013C2DAB2|nr:hypothetical protein [Pseudomonas viridiflava]
MSTHPVDGHSAQGPGLKPGESDGKSSADDNDVRDADINEVEPDDPDVAGDDASDKPS